MAEIGGRSAYIVDVPFKGRVLNHTPGFFQNGCMASGLHDPPLMKSQRAETTSSKTSSVADQGEFDLLHCRNPACLFIGWVVCAHIGQSVNFVHLSLG